MRRKRLGFTVMAIVSAWLAIMPVAAHAQTTTTVMQGEGVADATGLELSVLNLLQVTVDRAVGKFKVNTQDNTGSTSGYAAALCNLGAPNSDPRGCTGDKAESAAPGGPASSDKCPTLNVLLVTVNLACAKSNSKMDGPIQPSGHHEATLAGLNVGLTPEIKALLGTVTGTVTPTVATLAGTLTTTLNTALAPTGVAAPVDPGAALTQVTTTLTTLLNDLTNLVSVKVLPATVDVESMGTNAADKKASAVAKANIVQIGLLGGSKGHLIEIEVTPSLARATFNAASGTADCHAEAAIVKIKVRNLLGDGNLVDLAPGLNLDLNKLLPITNGLIGVKLATATPDSTGAKSCRAEARGLELNLLGLLSGGIQVRAAAANAEIAGATSTFQVAGAVDKVLPTTGGPTSLFLAGGVLLAVSAFGAFRLFRKVQHTA